MQTTIQKPKNLRDSNMELLRITAMILVLVVHASFLSLGTPKSSDFQMAPTSTFFRLFSESVSIICVNVFVLISGWYGIKAKLSRMLAFLFQVYFLNVIVYYGMKAFGGGNTGALGLIEWLFMPIEHYWFVKAYILLYILTPALNAFVDKANKKQVEQFLIAFFCVQTIIGFWWGIEFSAGYSALSFIGLYVLARYMYIHPIKFTQLNKYIYLAMYFVATMITTVVALLMVIKDGNVGWFYYYNSPLVIFASVCILLFFSNISIHSKIVNWVAISCFAAYVIHCSQPFFHTAYLTPIKKWYDTEPVIIFLLYTILLIAIVFIASILLDKIRISVWKFLSSLYIFASKKLCLSK